MPKPQAIQTRFAEQLRAFKADFVPKVAALNRPVLGNVPVSKDERRRRWWQQDAGWSEDQERTLLTATMPDGTPLLDASGRPKQPLSAQDVGLLKYPYREIDAVAHAAGDDRKAALYAREMSDMGPPDPDPLEMAAQGVGVQEQPDTVIGASMPALMMTPPPVTAPAAPDLAAGRPMTNGQGAYE